MSGEPALDVDDDAAEDLAIGALAGRGAWRTSMSGAVPGYMAALRLLCHSPSLSPVSTSHSDPDLMVRAPPSLVNSTVQRLSTVICPLGQTRVAGRPPLAGLSSKKCSLADEKNPPLRGCLERRPFMAILATNSWAPTDS